MREIKAIIRTDRVDDVIHALHEIEGLPGITISVVRGIGRMRGEGHAGPFGDVEMAKVEIVVADRLEGRVVSAIVEAARTGRPGEGKIFVYPVGRVIRIRTGDEGEIAL